MSTFEAIRPKSPGAHSTGSTTSLSSTSSRGSFGREKIQAKVFFEEGEVSKPILGGLLGHRTVKRLFLSTTNSKGEVVRLDQKGISTKRGFFQALFGINKAHATIMLSSKHVKVKETDERRTVKVATPQGPRTTREKTGKKVTVRRIETDVFNAVFNAKSLAHFLDRMGAKPVKVEQLVDKNSMDVGVRIQDAVKIHLESMVAKRGHELVKSRTMKVREFKDKIDPQIEAAEDRISDLQAKLLNAKRARASNSEIQSIQSQLSAAEAKFNDLADRSKYLHEYKTTRGHSPVTDIDSQLLHTFGVTRMVDSDEEAANKIARVATKGLDIKWVKDATAFLPLETVRAG